MINEIVVKNLELSGIRTIYWSIQFTYKKVPINSTENQYLYGWYILHVDLSKNQFFFGSFFDSILIIDILYKFSTCFFNIFQLTTVSLFPSCDWQYPTQRSRLRFKPLSEKTMMVPIFLNWLKMLNIVLRRIFVFWTILWKL